MKSDQIAIEQYTVLCGLNSNEIIADVTPGAMHVSLFVSYQLLDRTGLVSARDLIVSDINAALDLGASKRAKDLLIVLLMLLSEHRDSTKARSLHRAIPR